MAAIERGPSIPDGVRMIYPLPASYKARLEALSIRERKTVAHLTTLTMMDLIDRLDPIEAAPKAPTGKKPADRKKSGSTP